MLYQEIGNLSVGARYENENHTWLYNISIARNPANICYYHGEIGQSSPVKMNYKLAHLQQTDATTNIVLTVKHSKYEFKLNCTIGLAYISDTL